MSSIVLNERLFYYEGSASGKNGFGWVPVSEREAEKRE